MAISNLNALKTALGLATVAGVIGNQLTQLLGAAEGAIKRYCDRDLESVVYPGAATDGPGDAGYYNGTGRPELVLLQYPVTAVSAIYVDPTGYAGQGTNPFPSSTLQVSGTDYFIKWDGFLNGAQCSHSGIVLRISGVAGSDFGFYPSSQWSPGSLSRPGRQAVWPAGNGNIKVAYTAGYPAAAMPADLVQAANNLAAWMWNTVRRGGMPVASESLADYSVSFAIQALTSAPELGTTRQLLQSYRRPRF